MTGFYGTLLRRTEAGADEFTDLGWFADWRAAKKGAARVARKEDIVYFTRAKEKEGHPLQTEPEHPILEKRKDGETSVPQDSLS